MTLNLKKHWIVAAWRDTEYSVRMRENADQNYSEYRNFSSSGKSYSMLTMLIVSFLNA